MPPDDPLIPLSLRVPASFIQRADAIVHRRTINDERLGYRDLGYLYGRSAILRDAIQVGLNTLEKPRDSRTPPKARKR